MCFLQQSSVRKYGTMFSCGERENDDDLVSRPGIIEGPKRHHTISSAMPAAWFPTSTLTNRASTHVPN